VRIHVSAAALGWIRDKRAVTDDGAISVREPSAVTTPEPPYPAVFAARPEPVTPGCQNNHYGVVPARSPQSPCRVPIGGAGRWQLQREGVVTLPGRSVTCW
jgi:hypothetical protein